MAAADYDARSFKKALAQRGTCIVRLEPRPCSRQMRLGSHTAVPSQIVSEFGTAASPTG
jgi:hypothetical protein